MTTVLAHTRSTADQTADPTSGTADTLAKVLADTLAKVLADIMRVARVPVDSHFFDDLGADSLVMAHFCARVRKRADLPAVSMKDIYAHPTIRASSTLTSSRSSGSHCS